jgi:hypothetical protein
MTKKYLTKTQQEAGCWWLKPVILATWAQIGKIIVQSQFGQIFPKTPFPKKKKKTTAKWTGGVAQAVEHKALSSNPNSTPKKLNK